MTACTTAFLKIFANLQKQREEAAERGFVFQGVWKPRQNLQKLYGGVALRAGRCFRTKLQVNFTGKQARRSADGKLATYRIDGVSVKQAGTLTLVARTGGRERRVLYAVTAEQAKQRAKNVILFVSDGMSLQAREIARILSKGMTEEKHNDLLEMEKMPHVVLVTTSGYDFLVIDLANSASADATGQKGKVNAMARTPTARPIRLTI